HPRLARRGPEARLRDHDRRRGDLRAAPRAGHALCGPGTTRETRTHRSARARGPAPAVPAHRRRSDDPADAARGPLQLRPDRPSTSPEGTLMAAGTWLLRLYPETWRARYGAELTDLLLARPPSPRDRLDILRGAVDARLNPQLTEEPVLRVPTAADRLLALAGFMAGSLFTIWASIIAVSTPPWGSMALADEGLMAAAYGAGLVGMIFAICVLVGLATRYVDELGS